jgi:hypothetical protein
MFLVEYVAIIDHDRKITPEHSSNICVNGLVADITGFESMTSPMTLPSGVHRISCLAFKSICERQRRESHLQAKSMRQCDVATDQRVQNGQANEA